MNQTEDTMVFKPHVQSAYVHRSLRMLTGFVVGLTPHGDSRRMVTGEAKVTTLHQLRRSDGLQPSPC